MTRSAWKNSCRAATALALVATLSASDYGDGGTAQAHNCTVGASPDWLQSGLQFTKDLPVGCPYIVAGPNALIQFTGQVLAPEPGYVGLSTSSAVFNRLDEVVSLTPIAAKYVYVSNGIVAAFPATSFYGASTSDPVQDSGVVVSQTPPNGNTVEAYALLAGEVGVFTDISGPTRVSLGATARWSGLGLGDTLSYLYRWRVDGQNLPDATGHQYSASFGTAGNYQMSVVMTRADGTADTNGVLVTVPLGVSIDGPRDIWTPATYTYQAIPAGNPNGSYTYLWSYYEPEDRRWYDIGNLSTRSKYIGTSMPNFRLRVKVSATGYADGLAEIAIINHTYEEPPCQPGEMC